MGTVSVSLTAVLFVILLIGWWTGRVHPVYSLVAILLGLTLSTSDLGQSLISGANTVVTTLSKIGS
jgi:hypothetical protein